MMQSFDETYCYSICVCRLFLLQFAGRDAPSTVISFAQKSLKEGQVVSKLHVIELGSVPGGWQQQQQSLCSSGVGVWV
jgi:hypothetical protein